MHSLSFSEQLLNWYDLHHRDLPWRRNPEPYAIWVSEIMLQQTRMDTVLPYYERFMARYPSVQDLAASSEQELLTLWAGLGYYRRARLMHAASKIIQTDYDGHFPESYSLLRELPGIGDYTAAAIASTAFGQRVPLQDGNVIRVVSRLYRIDQDPSKRKTKVFIQGILEDLIDSQRPGDFNQAMMELGALVCIPNGRPLCEQCPVSNFCQAYKASDMESYPLKIEKKESPKTAITVLLMRCKGKIALQKREEEGLLAGLYGFPHVETKLNKRQLQELYPHALTLEKGPLKKHVFSHRIWQMQAWHLELEREDPRYLWIEEKERSAYPLPKAFSQFIEDIEKAR